jgi:hypothetical protein
MYYVRKQREDAREDVVLFSHEYESEAAAFVFKSWPKAAVCPHRHKEKRSKYFKRENVFQVLLVWETTSDMEKAKRPVAVVSEERVGYTPELWTRNLTESERKGFWGWLLTALGLSVKENQKGENKVPT